MSAGRSRARVIGAALSVGAVMTVQACGTAGSTTSSLPPAAAPTAGYTAPLASPATTQPATPTPLAPAGVTPSSQPSAAATPKPAVPKQSAQQIVRAQPLVDGTPCTVAAKSCVDLDSQRAWLFDGKGKIVRGPVQVASGGKTEPTPPGYSLRVYLKDIDHVSNESFTNGVPDAMPYSVFFEAGGIAFHEGDPENPSGGCVHLSSEDAKIWYSSMQLGDQVQVVHASQELPARGLTYDGPMYGAGGVRAWEKEHGGDD